MTSRQRWSIALGIALAFVAGYAGSVFSTAAAAKQPFVHLESRIGKPLPAVRFIGPGETRLPEDAWRRGKVVLVLVTTECGACLAEGEFLRTVVDKRKDVKFLGVLSFEQDERSLHAAQTIFPFQVVRDDRMELIRALGLKGVPVKIYLEDGVVQQTWAGASLDARTRASFTKWLTET